MTWNNNFQTRFSTSTENKIVDRPADRETLYNNNNIIIYYVRGATIFRAEKIIISNITDLAPSPTDRSTSREIHRVRSRLHCVDTHQHTHTNPSSTRSAQFTYSVRDSCRENFRKKKRKTQTLSVSVSRTRTGVKMISPCPSSIVCLFSR